jgi:hypothetical protein
MVLCDIWNDCMVRPFFSMILLIQNGTWPSILGDMLLQQIYELSMKPEWFMQDGAPQHCELSICHWLDKIFTSRRIDRRGAVKCLPRFPDLNPMDFIWNRKFMKPTGLEHLRQWIVDEVSPISPDMLSSTWKKPVLPFTDMSWYWWDAFRAIYVTIPTNKSFFPRCDYPCK